MRRPPIRLRDPILPYLQIVMQCLPPSVNSYVRHTRKGGHYVSLEAQRFKVDMAFLSRGSVNAKRIKVCITITPGPKQKGDADNYAKVCLDGLKECGIIVTDAAVKSLTITIKDSPEDRKLGPKTVIYVGPEET